MRIHAIEHVQLAMQPIDGFRRAYVNDPFGNRIELMERA
jgi:hypothetical protein